MLTLTAEQETAVTTIISGLQQTKDAGEKYDQLLRVFDGDFEKEVHEYICPDGSTGYQIFLYKGGYIKMVGYGKESTERIKDWTLIEE
ncbi:MAG: hypothetical protein KAS32_24920 [Candidatus Peribacteraceae bacterium]|nr:hypothetical protein [Candidatus Peribacteraceae bacterium]